MKTWTTLFTGILMASTLSLTACDKSTETATETKSSETNEDVNPIDAREDIMHDWKSSMGIMGGMMKKPETFDLAKFQEEAQFLAESADTPWKHFTDKEAGMGESKEDVWTNPEEWQGEIDKFMAAANELNTSAQKATDIEGVKAAFGSVGASCKGCHQSFKAE